MKGPNISSATSSKSAATLIKPNIAIDLDGVCADFLKTFYSISRKWLKKPPGTGHVPHLQWDVDPKVLSPKEVDYIWSKIKNTRNFWMTLERLPNTADLMRRYNDFNCFFITNRVPTDGLSTQAQTVEWLFQMYAIKDAFVIVTDSAKEKAQEVESLGLDAFVDDKIKNCVEVKKLNKECEVFLLDAEWNRDYDTDAAGLRRASSLNDFLSQVRPASK